jgi:hypothetical protein
MWTDFLYSFSVLCLLIGIAIFIAFRKDTVEEARGRLSTSVVALVSWPGRFMSYRSGHGAHAI